MANVFFKRGHQAALDAMSAYIEGSFYLTDDTNRLYFAQASNKLVELNQYIHIIDSMDNLPTSATATLKDGDIYYVQAPTNILCIYKNGSWVQINPDTKLAANQNQVVTVEEVANSTDTVSVSLDIADTKSNHATGDFTVVGGDNVHVAVSGNVLTISADNDTTNTTYAIQTVNQSDKGRIKLHNTSSTSDADSTIDIQGTGSVTVTSTDAGVITVHGASAVTGISDGFDAQGEYTIELGGVNYSTDGVTPTIQYGYATGKKESKVFANGTAALDIYTRTEINELLASQEAQLDAMHYAGTVDSNNARTLLVSAPEFGVGTTYKAASNINLASPAVTAKIGDLIIAGGTNDTAVTWQVVPSGDDQFISIAGNASENLVLFTDSANNTNNSIGSISIEGGRKNDAATNAAIEVTASTSNNDKDVAFTVVHGAPGTGTATTFTAASGSAVQVTGTALTIPVITALSKDDQGHITSITGQNYTLTDTHAVLQPISTAVEASNNEATVSASFQLDSATARTASFGITSDNLTITAVDEDVVVNLVWGTF